MFFEKIINIFDLCHQRRIINYLKKHNIEYFIDVGAHKGEFLSYLLTLNYKKIYCFEPQKQIYKILYKKFRNKKNLKLFNLGLADKKSKLIFYVNKLTLTSTFSKSKNTFLVLNFLRVKMQVVIRKCVFFFAFFPKVLLVIWFKAR